LKDKLGLIGLLQLLWLMVDGMQLLPLLLLAGNKEALPHLLLQHLLPTGSERVTHEFYGWKAELFAFRNLLVETV